MRARIQTIIGFILTNIFPVIFLAAAFGVQMSEAATYHVSKSGSNSYSCAQAQSTSTAKGSIQSGIGCLTAGDTLVIHAGTYHEDIAYNRFPIPSGSEGKIITMKAGDGEAVIVDGDPNDVVTSPTSLVDFYDVYYWTISGMIFDGRDVIVGGITINASTLGSRHIRLENNEIKRAAVNGIFIGSDGVDIINNTIHDGGHYPNYSPQYGYCLYNTAAYGIIDGNKCYNVGRYGFQFYSQLGHAHDNIIRNNIIHHTGTNAGAAGIVIGGANQVLYNNVIFSNNGHGIDIDYSGPATVQLYNNTIFGNSGYGVTIGIDSYTTNTMVKNNIIYQNSYGTVSDNGIGTQMANNLFSDPGFVNASSENFHLAASSSPAVNAGVSMASIFTTDADGASRANGFDLGAYEFGGTSSKPPVMALAAPANLRLLQ